MEVFTLAQVSFSLSFLFLHIEKRDLDVVSDVTALQTLPLIARKVGDRAEVFLDGGIRCGADILKAIALGARAVLIGR